VADQVYNVGLGRVAELYRRVDLNDPTDAGLRIIVLASANLETDAVLKDKTDLADLVAGATTEVTNTNYTPKVLTDVDLVVWAPDHANDRVDLDIPDQTWSDVAAGDNWSRFVTSFDPVSSAHVAANTEPMTQHDFVVIPDGSDITAQVNAAGFYRAS